MSDHSDAYRDVLAAGQAITLTKDVRTYNEDTDVSTVAKLTLANVAAMRVRGDPMVYAALGLKERESPTLLCVTEVYGDEIQLGMEVPWGGEVYTTRDVNPVQIDGVDLLAKVVIAR